MQLKSEWEKNPPQKMCQNKFSVRAHVSSCLQNNSCHTKIKPLGACKPDPILHTHIYRDLWFRNTHTLPLCHILQNTWLPLPCFFHSVHMGEFPGNIKRQWLNHVLKHYISEIHLTTLFKLLYEKTRMAELRKGQQAAKGMYWEEETLWAMATDS